MKLRFSYKQGPQFCIHERFYKLLLKALFILAYLFSYSLRAQQKPAQEPEFFIETSDSFEGAGYWDEHFSAGIGSSYAYGVDRRSYRAYSYAHLGWKDEFDWISFEVEGLIYRRDYQYSLELNPDDTDGLNKEIQATQAEINKDTDPSDARTANAICSEPMNSEPMKSETDERKSVLSRRLDFLCADRIERQGRLEFLLALRDNQLLWREANVKLKLGDYAQFLAGWHTIVWGQLDFLSPVDFVLPFRIGSTGLGITKADNRNPQLAGILYLFPRPWIEVQAYFFPDLGIDQAFLDNLQQEAIGDNSDYRDVNSVELPEGQDKYRYAGRVLFYLDELTLGFTYYQGYFQFDADENLVLTPDTKNGREIYLLSGDAELQPIRSYGFESALPMGQWTWKLDAVYFTVSEDLDLDVQDFNNQILGYLPRDEFYEKRRQYINWILNKSDGQLEVLNNVSVITAGVDANLDDWLLNLGLALFAFPRSSNDAEGVRLYRQAEDVQDDGFSTQEFFAAPIINAAYYLDADKKDAIGLAAGFLNTGFGVILYGSQEFFESLRVAISLEYLVLFSNGLVDVDGYQLEDPAYPAVRFILDYQF